MDFCKQEFIINYDEQGFQDKSYVIYYFVGFTMMQKKVGRWRSRLSLEPPRRAQDAAERGRSSKE